jgi:hypothetical protein
MTDPSTVPPVVDGITVHTRATTYTVTCLPDDPRGGDAWDVTVEFRGAWKWLEPRPADEQWAVVLRGHWNLSRAGKWDLAPSGDDDGYDDWIADHRYDLDTALRVAAEQAPHVVVNGETPAGVLAWRAGR